MTNKKQNRFDSLLTNEDKHRIATAVFEAKKNDLKLPWPKAMAIGRAAVPEERAFSKSIIYPSSIPWLMRALIKMEQEQGIKIIDTKESDAENKRLFAKTFHEVRKSNPRWTINQIVREANTRVPANCKVRDTINGIDQLKWLRDLLKSFADADTPPKAAPEPIEPVIEKTPLIEAPIAVALAEPPVIQAAPTPSLHETLESVLIAAVVGAIKPVLFDIIQSPRFASALRDAFGDLPQPIARPAQIHPPTPADIRKKILIVGLIGQQSQEIRCEFGKLYDLRIFDSEVTTDKIRSNLINCDKAIIMTKFISHRVQDAVRGLSGFTYCNGGVSALKELLTSHGH